MRILITGGKGQLGRDLEALGQTMEGMTITTVDIDTLDICDCDAVNRFLDNNPFDALVNAAAYTAVDQAESEPENAFLVNGKGPEVLARATAQRDISLVHVSTDYVFDGRSFLPYTEKDEPNPQSVYGRSKLEGEHGVLRWGKTACIIRTSWLYSNHGKNFVQTIRKLAKERGRIRVVFDQVGSPTHACDLARAILEMLPRMKHGNPEIFHYANLGVASWFDFAHAIVDLSGLLCTIEPIHTCEYPTPAKRPAFSVLNTSYFRKSQDIEIPHWRDSLKRMLESGSPNSTTDSCEVKR
ncbi:MAG: dTDP-4-dehydrorhamnose reductase [Marinilabiliales bacterium]|nr:dTDP-4-dehydrorhamnose reductase [Marinilabiliales bacterium]